MNSRQSRPLIWVGSAALAVIIADYISKFVVIRTNILPYAINRGVAFSLPVPEGILFVLMGVIAVVGWIAWQRQADQNKVRRAIPVGLIVGGALANLIDRIVRGGVVDFIDVRFWPSFNLADSAIVIGSILLVWYAWRTSPKPTSPKTSHATSSGRAALGNRKSS